MGEWTSAGKGKYGLRYREHLTKTTGVGRTKRPLRYYMATFKFRGKAISDSFGWEDSFRGGVSTIESIAAQLHANRKMMTPPFTYQEMLKEREASIQAEEEASRQKEAEQERQNKLIYNNMFQAYCLANEHKTSLTQEKSYHKNWISPIIGNKPLSEIDLSDLEQIQSRLLKAGRAPQTLAHIKKIIRQTYNYAIDHDLYFQVPPTDKFLKKNKFDNKRKRYLTPEQVADLLDELKKVSITTYRMALLSVHTGMRFGEIASLEWQHIHTGENKIMVLDSKNDEDRIVYMNNVVRAIFAEMFPGPPSDLVFPARSKEKNKRMKQVSDTFWRCVDKLGLNDGITDRRLKVVFHTLRHSCASWLANDGYSLQTIAKVLGHRTTAMTERYSHISDSSVKDAMRSIGHRAEEQQKINIFDQKD
jgi:integrase